MTTGSAAPVRAGRTLPGRAAVRVAQGIAAVGLTGLIALSLMTVADVGMRYLFNAPIYGVADLAAVCMAVIVASCMPAALARKQHITIRALGKALGPRVEAVLEAFGQLLTLAIFAVLAWQFWLFVGEVRSTGTTTWILAIPLWPGWLVATIFVTAALPVHAVVVLRDLAAAFSGRPAAHDDDEDAAL